MPDLAMTVLAAQAFTTLFMTGLVWFVHVIHYPLFTSVARAGAPHWQDYEREHLRRTGLVIPPVMLLEGVSAAALPFLVQTDRQAFLAWIGVGLLVVVWMSTFAGALPMHRRLAKGFDPVAYDRLMRFNLIRCLTWTARGVIVLFLLLTAASP